MRFIRTAKVGADPLLQLASSQQAVMLDHVALGMHPFGFNGIEPRTLRGQQERQNPHTLVRLFDLLVMLADPATNRLTLVPGGVIPDQEPVRLAFFEQALATPLQELGGDGAHRSASHEPQPGLRAVRLIGSPLLPEHAITGQRLGIRVVLAPGLLHQPYRLVLALPGVHLGQRKATPPNFIAKADRPAWLLAGPSNQAVPRGFFLLVLRIGAGDPVFGPLPVGFQAFERAAHTFVGDGGGDDALLEADLGCQLQGPPPALFAKVAGTAMQQVFEAHKSVLREAGVQPMGARGAFLQHRQPRSIELVDYIAHSLVVAAQLASNRRGSFPTRRGSQDLAATHHKGIGRTQSRLDLVLFVLGERSDKNGCSHAY